MSWYKKVEALAWKRIVSYVEWNDPFYKGSGTYFTKLAEEVQEACDENKNMNRVYLEYELADIFRNYMCLLQPLKVEWKIDDIDDVLERSYNKFIERVGEEWKWVLLPWDEVKKVQKQKIQNEHDEYQKSLGGG
jgi:phosphoribosyl-ATP pyrophosphohydrolase